MEFNRISGRANYNVIKREDFGVLFNETSSMAPGFPSESMEQEEIENLPLAWQYLLPHVFYDGLKLEGEAWAKIVNKRPLNSALLFKVALILRDEDDLVKDRFIHKLKLPENYRDDLGYILGYRWGISQSAVAKDFNMVTLLHLPVDIVMQIRPEQYLSMDIPNLLKDHEAWEDATP